jgi:hypothetical protein
MPLVDQSDPFGLILDDGDLVFLHLIAEGQGTPEPKTFPFGGNNLVPDVLGSDLPLELGKGQPSLPPVSGRGCGTWPLREGIFRGFRAQRRRFLGIRLCEWLSLRMMVGILVASQVPGIPVERWLFFAEAKHTMRHYGC